MSRIKKLIVAVLCVVLAVTASLLVFAACDKDETGYKVTLNYIKEQGSVTVSAPAEGKLYDANERVTVTVTPNADYQVAAFTVNGTAKELTDGTTYAFDITADTTIAVTFEPTGGRNFQLSDIVGKWTGEFEDLSLAIQLVITNTSIQVNGNDATNIQVNGDNVTFSQGSFSYTITLTSTGIHIKRDFDGNIIEADLTKIEDGGDEEPECEWTYFIGRYIGYDGSKFYTMSIDEDGINIVTQSSAFSVTPLKVKSFEYNKDDQEFTITIDDTTYSLQSTGGNDDHSTQLYFFSGDFDLTLSREDEDAQTVGLDEIAGTWTGTESTEDGDILYTLVINADGTGSAKLTIADEDMPLVDVRYDTTPSGHICIFYKVYEDDEVCSCIILYYDGTDFNVLAAMMGGSLTLTKTAGGDEETVTIPDKFIGEYSTMGYEVTITADSITITVKGTTETPDITETVTNIKVEGDTITCTFYGDTCTITAIGAGDKAQQISLTVPTFGAAKTLDRKSESGGDTDLTEESFYGTFEGSDSIGDYVLEISADGITFTITYKTEPGAPTTVNGENVSFVDGAIHFTISGAMEVIVTNASQGDTITKIHVECSYMELSADLTRKSEGGDITTEIPEKFYGTFEGSDEHSKFVLEISADGITLSIIDLEYPDYPATGDGEDVGVYADGSIHFIINGEAEFVVTGVSQDDPITQIHIECGAMTVSVDLTRKSEQPQECEWTFFVDKWVGTAENEDVYSIEITETSITVLVNGQSKQAEIVEFEDSGSYGISLTIKIDGTEYYITFSAVFGGGIMLTTNGDDLIANLERDLGESKPFNSLSDVVGTWKGTETTPDGDYEYTIVIESTGYGTAEYATDGDIEYIYDPSFEVVDGVLVMSWTEYYSTMAMHFYYDGTNLKATGVNGYVLTLTKEESSGDEVTFSLDVCGTYTATNAAGDKTKTVTVVITEHGISINEVEATNLTGDGSEYSFECNSVNYNLTIGGGQLILMSEDMPEIYNLTRKAEGGGSDVECKWTEYIGTYSAQDIYLYTVVISAESIHITYDNVDYTVAAKDITFEADYGFTWTYQDVEYRLEISDEDLYFADVADQGDYCALLSRVD